MNKPYKFKTALLLLIVGLVAGIMFAVQFRVPKRTTNPVTPVIALQNAKDSLEKDQVALKESISKLRETVTQKQGILKSDKKTSKSLLAESEDLREKAGLTEKIGKGVVITIADTENREPTVDSIVHAADIRDIVNALWQYNAQAVSINDQRVVSTTSVDSIVNTVLINNIKITNPFVIKAIGDSGKLQNGLQSGVNLKDILRRQKNNGLIFNVEAVKQVTIAAFDGAYAINFARIEE